MSENGMLEAIEVMKSFYNKFGASILIDRMGKRGRLEQTGYFIVQYHKLQEQFEVEGKETAIMDPVIALILKVDMIRLIDEIGESESNVQSVIGAVKSGLAKDLKGISDIFIKSEKNAFVYFESIFDIFMDQVEYLAQNSLRLYNNTHIFTEIYEVFYVLLNFCFNWFADGSNLKRRLSYLYSTLLMLDESDNDDLADRIYAFTATIKNCYNQLTNNQHDKTGVKVVRLKKQFIQRFLADKNDQLDINNKFAVIKTVTLDMFSTLLEALFAIYDQSPDLIIDLKSSFHSIYELFKALFDIRTDKHTRIIRADCMSTIVNVLIHFLTNSDYAGKVYTREITGILQSHFDLIKLDNAGLIVALSKLVKLEYMNSQTVTETSQSYSYTEVYDTAGKLLEQLCRPEYISFQNSIQAGPADLILGNKNPSLYCSEMLSYSSSMQESIVLNLIKTSGIIANKIIETGVAPVSFAKCYISLSKKIFDQVDYFKGLEKRTRKACIGFLGLFPSIKAIFTTQEIHTFRSSYLFFCQHLGIHKESHFLDSIRIHDLAHEDSVFKLGKRASYPSRDEIPISIGCNMSVITFAHKQSQLSDENNISFANFSPRVEKSPLLKPSVVTRHRSQCLGNSISLEANNDISININSTVSKGNTLMRGLFSERVTRRSTDENQLDQEAYKAMREFEF